MTPEEFSKLLDELIDGAISAVDARIVRAQGRQWRNIQQLLSKLTTTQQGVIKPTQANIKTISRIKKALPKIIKDDLYVGAIDKYKAEFEKVRIETNKYLLSVFGNEFDPNKKVFEDILENALLLTEQTLLESGIDSAIVDELGAMLTNNVTSGSRIFDLYKQTREFLQGTDETLGRLASYSKLFVNDSINQFSRNYMESAAQGLKIVFYLYSGGKVTDSRKFCVLRTGHVFHIDEIHNWGKSSYSGPGTNGKGKWQGRNKFTTQSNIFSLLGGYNCMHRLIPSAESDVGPEDRARIENGGFHKFK